MLSLFSRLVRWGVPAFGLHLLCTCTVQAQMKEAEQMKDFSKVFGVQEVASAYGVVLLENKTSEGSVLAPGQQPVLSYLVTNNTARPIKTTGQVNVIH